MNMRIAADYNALRPDFGANRTRRVQAQFMFLK